MKQIFFSPTWLLSDPKRILSKILSILLPQAPQSVFAVALSLEYAYYLQPGSLKTPCSLLVGV